MASDEDAVTQRQYRRLVQRLDHFEIAEAEREKANQGFRRDVIDANDHQLAEMRKTNSLLDKMSRQTDYVARTLASRPCLSSVADNGDEECPEGHEGT